MPQGIATKNWNIRVVVLVGRLDFGRCALAARSPTALWPVPDRPALELLLDRLIRDGVERVVVCCGEEVLADVERVCRPFGEGVRLLQEDLAVGTAGCLRDAVGADPGDVVAAVSGSMISAPSVRELVEAHQSSGAAMTMVFNPAIADATTIGGPAEIYLCKAETLSRIPRGGYSDIKEGLIPAILAAGGTIRPFVLPQEAGNFHDRDSYLNSLFAHLARRTDPATASSHVDIHPTARIYGPVAISEGVKICGEALVMGPAAIGSGTVIGAGSNVIRSVLWEGVSVGERCELRETVVDRRTAIPAGTVLAEDAGAPALGRDRTIAETLSDGLARLDGLWQGPGRELALAVSVFAVIAALLWSYWATVTELWEIWMGSDEYSAGVLVPLLALYVVWLRRREIGCNGFRPAAAAGGVAFLFAQVIRGVGLRFMYGSGERLSLILSLGALILLLCGWSVLRKTATILLFLCLMLPWPNRIQSAISLPLQNWATTSAVFCLELLGYGVQRDGNIIHIVGTDASVAVAEACNGLRMVTAFFVIGSLVVLLAQRAWWEKTLVFASSVPIAMICNTLRLTATAIAFTLIKGQYWPKMFHDFGGYAMMPVALAMVVGEFWILTLLTTAPDQTRRTVVIRRRP
jgi:exosortase